MCSCYLKDELQYNEVDIVAKRIKEISICGNFVPLLFKVVEVLRKISNEYAVTIIVVTCILFDFLWDFLTTLKSQDN